MIQVDRHTIIQVLGSLMNRPQLLSDIDRYCLSVDDFIDTLDRFVFSAIYNLYINGAERIHTADIDNYLQSNSYAKEILDKNNGVAFIQDCESEGDYNNFEYYYNNLKKINLVRELQSSKHDVDEIYCDDIFDERYNEINNRFEKMSVNDIINKMKNKVAKLEHKFILNDAVEESTPGRSIRDKLKIWKQQPEVGCMLQGEIFNTITRGGRKGKLYIRSAGTSVGKSRSMVGDACQIAYPMRYDTQLKQWVSTGSCEKVLYIMTEQETEEIDTMILAYLTGYNEDVFTYATYDENDPRILAAIDIMEKYDEYMNYAKIPDPSSATVKNLLRRRNLQDGIEIFFYDYIFSSPAMLNEYRDLKIQEHVALRMFTTTLKNLAVELSAFIMTSTQISNDEENKNGGFRDFRNIRGSKAIIDLADFACIMSWPSQEELNTVSAYKDAFGYAPNLVIDIFKNRRGRWTQVRIWSFFDAGTCRRHDLFLTDSHLKGIDNFTIVDFKYGDDPHFEELKALYNTGEVTEDLIIDFSEPTVDYSITEMLNDQTEAFGDYYDKKRRVADLELDELL